MDTLRKIAAEPDTPDLMDRLMDATSEQEALAVMKEMEKSGASRAVLTLAGEYLQQMRSLVK